jgi:hypothetical protein
MTDTPNRILQPTPAEFDQALAILDPADHAGLLMLSEKPDSLFLLARPLIDPPQEVLEPLQNDLATMLGQHGAEHSWTSAGVKKPEYTGATYFDSELAVLSKDDAFRRINGFALAVKLCASLPETAARPETGTVEKAASSTPYKPRILTWLGLACRASVEEYSRVETLTNRLLYNGPAVAATRSRAYLAYIYEEKPGGHRNSFVPGKVMHERAEEAVPRGTAVALDRVRLFVHPEGVSTYRRVK